MKEYNIKKFLGHSLCFIFCNIIYVILYGYLTGILDYFNNRNTALRISDCLNVYVQIYSKFISLLGFNHVEPLFYCIFVITIFISLYILLYKFVTQKYFKIAILYFSLLILIAAIYEIIK